MDHWTHDDIEIRLTEPVATKAQWIGQRELLDQVLACWTQVTPDDRPLCPRLIGKPGMGKTTLAQVAGTSLGSEIYIVQCTMDTRPEDLVVTPVIGTDGSVHYHASPLVTAMVRGGVAILDEANRMSEKSWASLAPLLDDRSYLESVVAGVRIPAHENFRCCVTMNDDASTYEVPEYIISRIQPMISLDYPDRDDEIEILRFNVDFAPDSLLDMTADFLQQSHRHRLDYSTRDGIHIMRYALKLNSKLETPLDEAFGRAVEQVLGEGAGDFEARARESLIDDNSIQFGQLFGSLGSFFDGNEDTGDDGDESDAEDDS